jgi:predicted transcriptional regulator of viral defense system
METDSSVQKAIQIFEQRGGTLRTSDAMQLGIQPRTLYAMRDAGILERLSRGLYRLAHLPPLVDPDLVTVALRVPRAVICLVSALAFHELTTQIPHVVDIALRNGDKRPRLDHPPLRVFWFSGAAWREGIEEQAIDGVSVRIYGPEKSVADAFKYRRKLGLDLALEAVRRYRQRDDYNADKLLYYARVCRVENAIKPYLEMLM